MHKHRPLVKPIMIVTTTGYMVAVLGPYLADEKKHECSIRGQKQHTLEDTNNSRLVTNLIIKPSQLLLSLHCNKDQ